MFVVAYEGAPKEVLVFTSFGDITSFNVGLLSLPKI
jgi:hypothetical protein